MPPANRSALLTKTHKVLKKHYQGFAPNLKLPLLEQMVFGCCLENAPPDAAEQAYAILEEHFFDWNEIRVSTVTELSESMSMLPDSRGAGTRVQQFLQSAFESVYSFELEDLKKQNIGAAVKKLQKLKGVTSFGISHITQTSLGGHSIPVSVGALDVLYVIGVIDEKERAAGKVPGLERAIPKTKGLEFGSLLNQLALDYTKSPHSPAIRKVILSIAADSKDRFPKRKAKVVEAPAKPAKKTEKKKAKKAAVVKKKSAAPKKKVTVKKKAAVKKKKATIKKKTPAKAKKKTTKKKTAASKISKRKPR